MAYADTDARTATSNALILAGAVARGAFEVGVLLELAAAATSFDRIVATSAGALNAVVFGAGLATGRARHAAEVLRDLWLERGAWTDFASVSPSAWWHWQGLFDTSRVETLVRDGLERVVRPQGPFSEGGPPPNGELEVTLITTDLHGVSVEAPDGAVRTVHERPESFGGKELLDRDRWSAIARAAAASAAFPGLFASPIVSGTPRIDGGAVNNAPISHALADPVVDAIYVVSTDPAAPDPAASTTGDLGGLSLVGRLADILVNERLARDLITARKTNARLRRVKEAMDRAGLAAGQKDAVLGALGWRPIELFEVSPLQALEGTAFSGFFDRNIRERYVEAGKNAARAGLPRVGVS